MDEQTARRLVQQVRERYGSEYRAIRQWDPQGHYTVLVTHVASGAECVLTSPEDFTDGLVGSMAKQWPAPRHMPTEIECRPRHHLNGTVGPRSYPGYESRA
jgi:hypothetical protein